MMRDFDSIVVGGGVAGLMSALRLAEAGQRVLLLERDKLGCGATAGNHGVIHSGALFAGLHPEIVVDCKEAQHAYRSSFPGVELSCPRSWYLARPSRLRTFRSLWKQFGITYEEVSKHDSDA